MKHLAMSFLSAVVGGLVVWGISNSEPSDAGFHRTAAAGQQSAAPSAAPPPTQRDLQIPPNVQLDPNVEVVPAQFPPRRQPVPRTAQAQPVAPRTAQAQPPGLTQEEQVAVRVYERCNRSVVNINTRSSRVNNLFLVEVPSEGAGSGSVLDKSGHLLTNFHVIEGAHKISVTLYDGKTYDARLVGADPLTDVAVLRIDAPGESLHPVTLGDSNRMLVGMRVFAIGNPFGLERTLTSGIVSSLNRTLRVHSSRTVKSIIQIDAAINPGSSGGPLLDTQGHLIGMNTAIATRTGQNAGVGFAIPSNMVMRIVPELIEHGQVVRPEVGISKVYETDEGLLIASLTEGGPADRAGLQGPMVVRRRRGPVIYESVDRSAADLIVGVDDVEIRTAEAFLDYVERKQPGDRVLVWIVRGGKRMSVPVTLGATDD